jgi:hypothetical protein
MYVELYTYLKTSFLYIFPPTKLPCEEQREHREQWFILLCGKTSQVSFSKVLNKLVRKKRGEDLY